jgi:hypothetical protein
LGDVATNIEWPWKDRTVSTFDEIVETIIVQEETVWETWKTIFGIPVYRTRTETIPTPTPKKVPKTVSVEHVERHFSTLLLVIAFLVAAVAYRAELWIPLAPLARRTPPLPTCPPQLSHRHQHARHVRCRRTQLTYRQRLRLPSLAVGSRSSLPLGRPGTRGVLPGADPQRRLNQPLPAGGT